MQQRKDTEKLKHNTTNKENSSRYILVCILANNQSIQANLTEVKIYTSVVTFYILRLRLKCNVSIVANTFLEKQC
jgi:ribosomal protein S25